MLNVNWTEDRVEMLAKLWEEGLSASAIAAQIGGVTRNAVIGKVHRLGLAGRIKPAATAIPPKTKKDGAGMVSGNLALKTEEQPQAQESVMTLYPDNVIPMAQRVNLMGLKESTCRFPVGDPTSKDFYFCGGRSDINTPYCAFHSRITYQGASERKQRELKRIGAR
jgi:GcrA cell cycle regulator